MFDKFKKYKFTDKKKSKGGIVSTLLFLVAISMMIASIYRSYKYAGNGGTEVGVLAMTAFFMSLIGFFVGIKSFKEENVFYGFSWFGTICNTAMWLILIGLMLIGI